MMIGKTMMTMMMTTNKGFMVKRLFFSASLMLTPTTNVLQMAEVKAEAHHATEAAVTRQQQVALVTMTGVSQQQITRTQDKNAGEAIRRIPGVSIIDDKFVMVRGLAQRYNNVWLWWCRRALERGRSAGLRLRHRALLAARQPLGS